MAKGSVKLDVSDAPLVSCGDTSLTRSILSLSVGTAPVPVEHEGTSWATTELPIKRQVSPFSTGSLRSFQKDASFTGVIKSFRQDTGFAPEVVEQLEKTSPQGLAWLRSTCGILCQGALILSYVAFETASSLIISYVLRPDPPPKFKPLPTSIAVVVSGCCVMVGLIVAIITEIVSEKTPLLRAIPRALAGVFQWRSIASYSLVAATFSIAVVFSTMAYAKLDAGLKKVLDQLRLPLTAAMSSIVVGRRYSIHEWLSLAIVTLAICSFYINDVEHDAMTALRTTCHYPQVCFEEPSPDICGFSVDGQIFVGTAIKSRKGSRYDISTFRRTVAETDWQGLVLNLAATILNCLGSLFSERLMKSDASTPVSTQIAQWESTGFATAVTMAFLVPLCLDSDGGKAIWWATSSNEGSGQGFFQGFDDMTWIMIAMGVLKVWLIVTIVKHLSAVVQKIAASFVLLLTVMCTGTFLKPCQAESLPMTMFSLAFVICAATLLFAAMPKAPKVSDPSVACEPQQQARQTVAIHVQDGQELSGRGKGAGAQ